MFQAFAKLGPGHGPSLAPTIEPFEEDLLRSQIILCQHSRVPPHPVVVPIPLQFSSQNDEQVGQFHTPGAFDPFLESQQAGAELFLIGHSFDVSVVLVFATSRPVEVEAEEGEPSALVRVPALESHQRAFLFRELKRKFLQPLRQGLQVGAGITFILKADDAIVGISHEVDTSFASFAHHSFDPMVLGKVQVDVRQNGTNYSPLWRSGGRVHDPTFFHHSGFEPFHDQGNEATIRDAFFEHSHQPVVIHVIKEASDISFYDPAIAPALEGFAQVQAGLARSLTRSIADAFIIEVRFPDAF